MREFKLLTLCGLLLTGCTQNIDSDVYTSADVRHAARTYEGTIVSVRHVKMQNANKLTGNTEGMLLGGILGGVAGSAVGGGRGSAIAAVAGAAAGGGVIGAGCCCAGAPVATNGLGSLAKFCCGAGA